jgi:DNA (cytosine-5)-methyltransferase 1
MQLKVLDLFSGLGGFSLGLERTGYFKTIAFCEIDKYCSLILDKHWKGIKIYNDVRKINKEQFDTDGIEYPDIITGGFPCQPFSVAGKQKGTGDDRHLWPEMFRIIKTFKPKFVIGENVKGLINIQDGVVFETVCTDLESEGYEVQAFNIPAAGVGAPHRRERIWIIATNVVNSISDNEREQITRGDEEERRIQEEYRQDNSTARQSSRTSAIWNGDRGYEDMANSNTRFSNGTNNGRNILKGANL